MRSSPRHGRILSVPLLVVAVVISFSLTAAVLLPASSASSKATVPTKTYTTYSNYAGYEGNDVIYPTVDTNPTYLPALSGTGASPWMPSSLPYDNSTWPANWASIATSSPTYSSYYQMTGGSDYNFVIYFWAAASGVSQYYTTGCEVQYFSCSSNAEDEVLTWTPYQELYATASSMPSGFSTNIQGITYGMNMTAGNENNLNPTGGGPPPAHYMEDIALQLLGAVFPPVGDILTAEAIDNDVDHLIGQNGQYSGNGLSDNFAPVAGSGTVNEWGVTGNGTELNSSYSCPPYPGPTITWNYPDPNPCAPTQAQWDQDTGENTFGQTFGVYTSTGALNSLSNAESVLGSVTTSTSVTLGVQNNIEVYNPYSSTEFYGAVSTAGAGASLTYSFAPAVDLTGTVINSAAQTTDYVSGATVTLEQVCSGSSPIYFTETTGASGGWNFFANPSCTYDVSATDPQTFGTVGSPTQTYATGTTPAGGMYTFPLLALNNYPVTVSANGYVVGDTWSDTLSTSSASSTAEASTSSAPAIYAPDGSYTLTVTPPSGWAASPSSFSVTVNGAAVSETTSFTETFNVAFTESGILGADTDWSVTLGGTTQSAQAGGEVLFEELDGTYSYSVGSLSYYTISPPSGQITVDGSSVSQKITYTPTSTYSHTFSESGIPSGVSWLVSVDGGTYSATTPSSISVKEVPGTYSWEAFAADVHGACGVVEGYYPSPSTGSYSAAGTTSITYTYKVTSVISGGDVCTEPSGHTVGAEPGAALNEKVSTPSGFTLSTSAPASARWMKGPG